MRVAHNDATIGKVAGVDSLDQLILRVFARSIEPCQGGLFISSLQVIYASDDEAYPPVYSSNLESVEGIRQSQSACLLRARQFKLNLPRYGPTPTEPVAGPSISVSSRVMFDIAPVDLRTAA